MPGDYCIIELETPQDSPSDYTWALEPRFDSPANRLVKAEKAWSAPRISSSVANKFVYPMTRKILYYFAGESTIVRSDQ